MKHKILVFGNANMDTAIRLAHLPAPGELVEDRGSVRTTAGGKGATAALALARLGAKCFYCARVGDDANGKRIYTLLSEAGADTSYLTIDREKPTGNYTVIRESGQAVRRILFPGANRELSPDEVRKALRCLPEAIYLTSDLRPDLTEIIQRYARSEQIPVLLHGGPLGGMHSLEHKMPVEILTVNAKEAEWYTGIVPTSTDACIRCLVELQKQLQAKYYVLRLGDRGAMFYNGTYHQMSASFTVKATDTAGASEVFAAALTLAYLTEHGDIAKACRYANAAASFAVQKKGAMVSAPTGDKVRALLEKYDT